MSHAHESYEALRAAARETKARRVIIEELRLSLALEDDDAKWDPWVRDTTQRILGRLQDEGVME